MSRAGSRETILDLEHASSPSMDKGSGTVYNHYSTTCPHCGAILDRDENAARNLAAGGLRFSPNAPPGEAMVEEREPENATLILKVDGGKLSRQTTTTTINPDKDLTEPVTFLA